MYCDLRCWSSIISDGSASVFCWIAGMSAREYDSHPPFSQCSSPSLSLPVQQTMEATHSTEVHTAHIARLTDTTYLKQQAAVRKLWLQDETLFSRTTPSDQRAIHDFYQPSRNATNAELLKHRHIVTAVHPSLPSRASKALRRLDAGRRSTPAPPNGSTRPRAKVPIGGRNIRVRVILRPEPDVAKLARVFMGIARQITDEDTQAHRASGDETSSDDAGEPRSPTVLA